jgi:MFS family permease
MMDSSKQKKSGDIQSLKEDVTRSWYEDGMFEISIGITFVFAGLVFLGFKIKLLPRFLNSIIFAIIIVILGLIGSIWLPRKLKGKFVWRKTGYSIVKEPYPKSTLVFLGLSLLSGAFAVFGIRFISTEFAVFSAGFAFFFAYISQFFQAGRIKRFLFTSFIPLFAVGVCTLSGLSWEQSIAITFLVTGFVSLVSGIIVYGQFNRKLLR